MCEGKANVMGSALNTEYDVIEHCPVCGSKGAAAYSALTDYLYGCEGEWRMVSCESEQCGTFWLDPAPNAAQLAGLYDYYHTHSSSITSPSELLGRRDLEYIKAKFGYSLNINRLRQLIIRAWYFVRPSLAANANCSAMFLQSKPGRKRLLEVGPGNGCTMLIASELGWDVEGLDIDEKVVTQLSSYGLRVSAKDVSHMQYPDRYFDAILLNNVIEHVKEPNVLLAECARILDEEGTLHLTTPNASSLGHVLLRHRWRGLEPPRHLQIFSPPAIRNLCEAQQLVVEKCAATGRGAGTLLDSDHSMRTWQERSRWHRAGYRLIREALHYFEALISALFPTLGEETIIVARKR